MSWSYNPKDAVTSLVWAIPCSLATTYGITIVFSSSGYLDVSVHRVRFHCWMICLQHTGLPHSEISGLKVICTSPKLIAAYHVLHRLWEPRHPPYALSNFLNLFVTGALAPAKYVILTFSQYVNELFKGQNKKTPFKKNVKSYYPMVENKGVEPLTSRMQI